MPSAVRAVTFDSHDPYATGMFWSSVLGGRVAEDDGPGDPEVWVEHAGTPLLFVEVPDDKVVKNRVHLCLQPFGTRDEEVQRSLSLGATVVDDRVQADGSGWVVMADPEGNEFCVLRSAADRGEPEPAATGDRDMEPVHAADERTMLTTMLEWYREGVLLKVAGMRQEHAATSPLRSGTTAAGLVKHLALVEDSWFTHRFAQQPEPEPWASAPWDDDADWKFHSASDEPLEVNVARYRDACERSRAVAAAADLEDTVTLPSGRVISLRFALLHLIEETARHLGHLDVLRELADGVDRRVMVNSRTGESVEVLSETPELLVLRATWPAGGPRAVPHAHPGMQERWEVLEGRAVIDVDGRRSELAVGDSVVAEPGQVHIAANATDVPTVVRIEMRPALRWVEFVRRLFAGESPAVLLAEFPDEIVIPHAPGP